MTKKTPRILFQSVGYTDAGMDQVEERLNPCLVDSVLFRKALIV